MDNKKKNAITKTSIIGEVDVIVVTPQLCKLLIDATNNPGSHKAEELVDMLFMEIFHE